MLRTLMLTLAMLSLAACSGVKVTDYSANQPQLQLEKFFDGPLTAHGIVKDRGGRVTRYFNADIQASWKGDTGTLVEDFLFDDGEEQRRVWTLVRAGEGRYVGTAGDVVGEASLQVSGNSLFMDYVLRIPWGDGTIDLRVDDRMYQVNPTLLINESTLNKFGVRVGELVLVIERRAE